jgi:N-acetylneuraminic acid mutarotase
MMKEILKLTAFILCIGIVIFVSCKKEYSCEGCADQNKPPIAIAGKDTIIVLPVDSAKLEGSLSSDPDGTITSFFWTKIAGPVSFNINSATTARTIVKNLSVGSYQFELKVTDNLGLSAKDTMTVTVDATPTTNHPPIANAGTDQIITLPTNTVNLDGNGSTDPDDNITSYAWTKISGPSLFNIANTNTIQTQVTNLVEGIYQFELKVTDAGGLFSKDTMQLTVNPEPPPPTNNCEPLNRSVINAQLIPFGTLSLARSDMAVASAGNKIVFAGGRSASEWASSRVDIYDMNTNNWTTAELSIPRFGLTAITAGNKIFFAGGITEGAIYGLVLSRVDIYDVLTNTWSIAELSEPRWNGIAAAVIGNKVFFAGGENYSSGTNTFTNRVDIYNLSDNTWSIATLSQTRNGLTATMADEKIYFAGGWNNIDGPTSNIIDIYNGQTNSWSISSLATPRAYQAAIAIQNKIYWAGGDTVINLANEIDVTCRVEIRDVNTQLTSFTNLFQPNVGFSAFEKDNKIVYLPGGGSWHATAINKFDIYDVVSNTWSIGQLNQSIPEGAVISVNNIIYIAGGHNNNYQYYNQVWKLEF